MIGYLGGRPPADLHALRAALACLMALAALRAWAAAACVRPRDGAPGPLCYLATRVTSPTPACRHFPLCGGCQILDLDYPAQLRLKEEEVRRHFPAAEWPDLRIEPALPSPEVGGYRHKVQLPFGIGKGGVRVGCYEAQSHRVVDQEECLVQEPGLSRLAWAARDWAKAFRVPVYREETGEGWLRHLLLRRGAGTGEVLLGLVTNGPGAMPKDALEALAGEGRLALESAPGGSVLVGVVQNINASRTNVVLGREERVLWGRPWLKETLGPFAFPVGLSTFFQVNPLQTPRLYDLAVSALPAGVPALDLYCGSGTISLWASRRASHVTGIEENPASVEAARRAAADNGVANADFLHGDVTAVLGSLLSSPSPRRYLSALADPPRKGLEPPVRDALARLALDRLVYVSCYPATLARDAKALAGAYRLRTLTPVDMFPHTRHIEAVAVFDRA